MLTTNRHRKGNPGKSPAQTRSYFKIDDEPESWGGGCAESVYLHSDSSPQGLSILLLTELLDSGRGVYSASVQSDRSMDIIDVARYMYVPGLPRTRARTYITRTYMYLRQERVNKCINTRVSKAKDSSQAKPNSCLCQIRSSNFKVRHWHL